ncbi:Josephin-1 [Bulinus truncatus]|nr:Josephin-1 [Bulinus truncatus]
MRLITLLQKKDAFTKKDLDEICTRLSPDSFINPHRSMLGLGNYDVNVIMAALQEKGYETVWFDKRKNVNLLIPEKIMGFILNTPTDYKFGFLDSPAPIGDEANLLEFLGKELSNGEKELLLVVEKNVYDNSLWRRDSNGTGNKENQRCHLESNGIISGALPSSSLTSDIHEDKISANGAVSQDKKSSS